MIMSLMLLCCYLSVFLLEFFLNYALRGLNMSAWLFILLPLDFLLSLNPCMVDFQLLFLGSLIKFLIVLNVKILSPIVSVSLRPPLSLLIDPSRLVILVIFLIFLMGWILRIWYWRCNSSSSYLLESPWFSFSCLFCVWRWLSLVGLLVFGKTCFLTLVMAGLLVSLLVVILVVPLLIMDLFAWVVSRKEEEKNWLILVVDKPVEINWVYFIVAVCCFYCHDWTKVVEKIAVTN